MDITVNVVNQRLKISTNLKNYVEGTQKFIRFIFNLSNEWDNLLTFAQFSQNGESYNVYLDSENSVYMPPEIVAGTCTMMLYGTGADVIGTTEPIALTIGENNFASNASSTEISTSLYEQLSSRFLVLEDWKTEIENDTPIHWIEF